MSLFEAPAPNSPGRERRVTSRKDADFWVTPAWATEALLEREILPKLVWEPACGNGAMAQVLEAASYWVYATDLHDRGYGRGGVDFLLEQEMPQRSLGRCEAIVTNPPFALADKFIAKAHTLDARKICIFGPIGLLAGQARGSIYHTHPWSRVWVFSRRVTLLAGSMLAEGMTEAPKDMRGTQNFAWFVWERGHRPTAPGFIG